MNGSYYQGSSGIAWQNGMILTAQIMQQLDTAKVNTSVVGKPLGIAQLDKTGSISASVTGDVSGAGYGSGKLSDAFAGKINQTDGNAINLTGLGTTLATQQADGVSLALANQDKISERTAITFGNKGWVLLRDQPCDGSNDLALYNGATGHTPARWTQDEQLFITWEPTTVLASNAYDKTGSPVVIANQPGKTKPTVGTTIGLQVSTVVGDVDDLADNTRSEFGSYYGITIADPRRKQGRINLWGPDIHVFGKFTDDPGETQGFLTGYSAFVRPVGAGSNVINADLAGAYGASIVFNPPEAGVLSEYEQPPNTRSYPGVAGLSICGWSGTNDITSGEQAGADYASDYAVRIGGMGVGGGSGYIKGNARSKFRLGIGISDFDTKGLWITNPLTAPSGTAQWGIYNECPSYLSGVINAQKDALGFFGAIPAAQPTMWQVGGSGTVSDCIIAINRITSNLTSLGLFGAATS